MVKALAQALAARERDAGTAGLKDKRAVTVQRISIATKVPPEEALKLSGPGFRVLAAARHANKLRPGHLRGNRFRIVVRGVLPDALARAQAICQRLRVRGAANLFGPQRFGKYGDNAALGRSILLREKQVARPLPAAHGALGAAVGAVQPLPRARASTTGSSPPPSRATCSRSAPAEGSSSARTPKPMRARVESGEVDPAGPLPGHSLFAAAGEALRREEAVLAEAQVDPASFAAGGGEMEGARRPYRIPVAELTVEAAGADALALGFALPRGSYAVSVLREVTKADVAEADFSA